MPDAVELIEELQRKVSEFGNGPVNVADQIQPEWRVPITDIEFDPVNQAYVLITDS